MYEAPTDTYDTTSVVDYESYLKWEMWASDRTAVIKEFGSMEEFKKQANAYNNSAWWPREQELNSVVELRDKIESLLDNNTAIDDVTWFIKTAQPWDIENKNAFLWDIQNLLDWITLQSLIDAKGAWATFWALSNDELSLLQKSSSPLAALILKDWEEITWFKGWTDNFKEKLQTMLDWYNEVIEKKQSDLGIEAPFYTDKDWVDYTQDSLIDEMERQIKAWEATPEQWENFLEVKWITFSN